MDSLMWYMRTLVKKCLKRGIETSYAQFGEDVVISAVLRGTKVGTYVDVGAFDPVLYSNTYHFYKKGWRGVVIDPNPALGARFSLVRPRDVFVQTGVADNEVVMTYYMFNYPAYNTFDEREKNSYLATNSSLKVTDTQHMTLHPLRDILADKGVIKVDFLNVDAQGFDLQVLRSMGDIRPTVIAVEVESELKDVQQNPVYQFLTEIGYSLKGCAGVTLIFKIV